MTPLARENMRTKMLDALESFIDAFDKKPLYSNIGEYTAITFELAMSTDPNRPWTEAPDPEADGSYVDLQIKISRNESW